jgi:hypothetical protein
MVRRDDEGRISRPEAIRAFVSAGLHLMGEPES